MKIPKGHYEISFDKATTDNLTFKSKYEKLAQHKVSVIITLFLCVLLVVIGISNFTLNSELQKYRVINEFDPIWKDYLKSNLPILIVIGDHFFFNEYNETYQNLLAIRDGKINSFEDLEKLITLHPEKDLRPADEPYFPYHSIWSLPPILSILYSANQKPVLRRSSSIGPQLLNEYNIIFVGSIKTLYILKYTLSKSHFEFEISPHVVKYSMPDTNATQVFNTNLHSAGPNEDLVLTLKLPGPANNSIFIIASYHSLGAPEIANYLTNPTTRQDLENKFQEKYGKIPNYFELLFRVIGIDKTAYSTELLIYNEIIKENEPGALD